jgi:hypothetical protein
VPQAAASNNKASGPSMWDAAADTVSVNDATGPGPVPAQLALQRQTSGGGNSGAFAPPAPVLRALLTEGVPVARVPPALRSLLLATGSVLPR